MTTSGPPEYVDPAINHTAEIQAADDSLAVRVEALRKVIADLSPEVTKLQTDQKTVWGWLKSGAGFVAFDIIITIIGIIFGLNIHNVENSNRVLLDQVQGQQSRLNTSIHETCNLYGTFLSFYSDAAKARFAGGPAQYDQLYLTLQNSSDRLQCGTKHVVPGT